MRECKLPLRTVLQNFINNVESLEAKNENKEEVYEQEFQELKKLTESLKTHPDYVCTEGEKEYNKRKNRYKDILPYDRTRVVLQAFPGIPGSDYINANYIRGASGSKAYIASQGPLPNTVPDFWRMVVECDVQVIIMASNETEGGKHKCECYWVENEGDQKQFGNVVVSFIKSRQVCPDFLVRTLKIKYTTENNKTEERTICQFHYMLWPDHGVPDSVRPLLHMVRLVRDCQASETLPVLVHCSAGCGRTGTICAIDYVWGLLRTGKVTENLYLLGLVREMRVQRVAMVQTKEQYTLLHQAVKELFRDRLNLIDSHPYENVSTDGNPLMLDSTPNKESDYEELLLSHEKKDLSTKSMATSAPPLPPSITASSGSLTRKSTQPTNCRTTSGIDTLRRSASTSSLDTHRAHAAYLKEEVHHMPSTSVSLDASVSSRPRDVPLTKLGSFPSESALLHLHHPKHPKVAADEENCSPSRKPPRAHSKVEKEAENLAQRMENKERELRMHALSHHSSSSSTTAASVPPELPSPTQNTNTHSTLYPPVPPPRSRTPSPVISVRKIPERCDPPKKTSSGCSTPKEGQGDTSKRKSTEIVRRPSIQKLRELFEKSSPFSGGVIECPNGARLCRSASSITARPTLFSLHSDSSVSSLKVRRKGSLGSEQSLMYGTKAANKEVDSLKFQICPPPPPLPSPGDEKEAPMPSVVGKPPSSPVLGSVLGVKRKVSQIPCDESKEEKRLLHLSSLDDRPALPIKKSKSFRWSRPQRSHNSNPSVDRSPESMRKKMDLNTYFSLDRGKENSPASRGSKGESSIKKIANDFFPLPQEGLKLSVYEGSLKPKRGGSPPSEEKPREAKGEGRPQIPPKKCVGDKGGKNVRLLSLQIPTSRSSLQISDEGSASPASLDHSGSKEDQAPLSAPPDSFLSFEDKGFWDRMRETCYENIYDELPATRSILTQKDDIVVDSGKNPICTSSQTIPHTDTLQGTTDYVNARVLSTYYGTEETPRVSYLPLPSKRESKDKVAHDYANCSVFALPEAKSNTTDSASQTTVSMHNDTSTSKSTKHRSGEAVRAKDAAQSTIHSSDYEPVDFGEKVAAVNEVLETLNYEPLESKSKEKGNREKPQTPRPNYYLNKDLDSLAIQVYQDCQAYLLNGNSRSPVPSLMPKTSKTDQLNASPGRMMNSCTEPAVNVTNLEEVRNKVSVPPQGLRNRERRNSYRQAVSTVPQSYARGAEKQPNPVKKVHKYEKIWFETMKEEMDEEGAQRDDPESSENDISSNFNHPMNISGKEALFKDKLEEIHGIVTNLERKKLPDLSEEELSSRDSGSTSSLLSRSAQSSRSSERVDPIYANVHLHPGAGHGGPQPSSLTGEPPAASKLQHPPMTRGTSPYGTLATTTSYPYKPRMAPKNSRELGPNCVTGFKSTPGAATLPARSVPPSSPPPPHIPPPLAFGNPSFQIAKPYLGDTKPISTSENVGEKKCLFPPIFRGHPTKSGNPLLGPSHDSDRRQRKQHHKSSGAKVPPFPKVKSQHQHQINMSGESAGSSTCKDKEKGNSTTARQPQEPLRLSPHSPVPHDASSTPNPSLNPSVYYHAPMTSNKLSTRLSASAASNGSTKERPFQGTAPPETSSTDTEEEPPPQKASASNLILRKLKGANGKVSMKIAAAGKSDDFIDPFFGREERERGGKRALISPPGSPRAFTKAFGKLKLGSKSVAANFKSYLTSKGHSDTSPSDGAPSEPANCHYPLQKSVSSGAAVNVFSQVMEDSNTSSPLPKKTHRDPLLPHNFRYYDLPKAEPKASRARQQYL